ncbi:hypothetical protein CAEBREN_05095 [Caenorhabditis brenneri]|uniref:Uncharacterized protein n=1 Tax=Caenorhabditis brenneri TaxID=135651 RepID=G0PG74_CAEBE|nr:hypothetical protein CAEBREN_05095 [Caenorhabditis brenneri]
MAKISSVVIYFTIILGFFTIKLFYLAIHYEIYFVTFFVLFYIISSAFGVFSCMVMSEIHNTLLIFSGIFRFFVYFFPSTEQFIVRLQNQIISRVHYIYGFYFIKGLILLVLKLREALDEDKENLGRIKFLQTTSPIIIVLCLTAQFDHVSVLFYIIDLTDILITPFAIMISYLSCNKRNVEAMFRPVTSRFKKLFGKCFKNSVQPTTAPNLIRNV